MGEALREALMTEEKPSRRIEVLARDPAFRKRPFDRLLQLKKTEQSPVHHPEGTVWTHTMMVVDEAAKVKSRSKNHEAFMWAALLHDIGKPPATFVKNGRIVSYDHDRLGAEMAAEFLAALGCDDAIVETVRGLVRYHMHMLFVLKKLPFADVPGLLRETDPEEVALLCLCDRLGRGNADPEKERAEYRRFLRILKNAAG